MSIVKILSVCLIVLCCSDQSESHVCKWTKFMMAKLNKESIILLEHMGGLFPSQCLEEKVERIFPEGLYKNARREDVIVVALQAFGHVDQIFGKNLSSVSWDLEKVRLFGNHISRQVEKLTACVGDAGASSVGGGVVPSASSAYFDSLSVLLRKKNYSACAWEIVREEVQDNLKQFKTFLCLLNAGTEKC